jgi:hypothetical protein
MLVDNELDEDFEIVIGLVAPIGTNVDKLVDILCAQLETVSYASECMRLSSLLDESPMGKNLPATNSDPETLWLHTPSRRCAVSVLLNETVPTRTLEKPGYFERSNTQKRSGYFGERTANVSSCSRRPSPRTREGRISKQASGMPIRRAHNSTGASPG